ncbi:hypothetical protein EV368DRAFT_6185, partial [Lentinula lateritia]
IHNLPVEPTPDTLSFYTVFMSHYISSNLVDSYLSGITNQLEPYFPHVCEAHKSPLISHTLKGCKRLRGKPVTRKLPFSHTQIQLAIDQIFSSSSFDNLLWTVMLATSFYGLLRLAEMTIKDNPKLRNPRKYTQRLSAQISDNFYSFLLLTHKANTMFQGNRVLINNRNARQLFINYLAQRDSKFPINPYLWLRENRTVPTRCWFMTQLRNLFPDRDFTGQSMRAGGATALAEDGAPPHVIQ